MMVAAGTIQKYRVTLTLFPQIHLLLCSLISSLSMSEHRQLTAISLAEIEQRC